MTDACFYCGTDKGPIETDHVVPTARGGPDTQANKVRCCYACNRSKNDLLPSEWKPKFKVPAAALDIEVRIMANYEVRPRSRRGRQAAEDDHFDYFRNDPFEKWVSKTQNAFGLPFDILGAATFVRDTIECAATIAQSEFKSKDPKIVLEIYKQIDSRQRYLEGLHNDEQSRAFALWKAEQE